MTESIQAWPDAASQVFADQPSSTNSVQPFGLGELTVLLNAAGNFPPKTAIAALMAREPERAFVEHEIRDIVLGAQQRPYAWRPSRFQPAQYCARSFVPHGLALQSYVDVPVKKGLTESRRVTAYRMHPAEAGHDMALYGVMLQTALDFPDFSFRRVFGQTAAPGVLSAAEVTYRVLGIVCGITRLCDTLTPVEIADRIHEDRIGMGAVSDTIERLIAASVLKKTQLDITQRAMEVLTKEDYPPLTIGQVAALSPRSRVIYEAIEGVRNDGWDRLYFARLLGRVRRIDPEFPDTAVLEFWQEAYANTSRDDRAGTLGLCRFAEKMADPKTGATSVDGRVKLHPRHAEASRELIVRLRALQEDPDAVQEGYRVAYKILGHTAAMRTIFARAVKGPDIVSAGIDTEEVLKLFRQARAADLQTALSNKELRERLVDTEDKIISKATMRQRLTMLLDSGTIIAGTKPIKKARKRQVTAYWLAGDS